MAASPVVRSGAFSTILQRTSRPSPLLESGAFPAIKETRDAKTSPLVDSGAFLQSSTRRGTRVIRGNTEVKRSKRWKRRYYLYILLVICSYRLFTAVYHRKPQEPAKSRWNPLPLRDAIEGENVIRITANEVPYSGDRKTRDVWTFRPLQAPMPPALSALKAIHHDLPTFPQKARLDNLPFRIDPTDVVFHFITGYERAMHMTTYWTHFLKHGSRFVVSLMPDQAHHVNELQAFFDSHPALRGQGTAATVVVRNYPRYEHAMLDLPRRSQSGATGRGEYKWLVVLDDDTQFLDIRTLMRELGQRDPGKPNMLCGVSESIHAINTFGRMCYGGAGIIISRGLASAMADRTDECLAKYGHMEGGDGMLTECAALVTGLTKNSVFEEIPGLHQMDLMDDVTGYMQSGLPFTSLHHWGSWTRLFPPWVHQDPYAGMSVLQKAANLLGGDNIFRRYIFDSGKLLYTSGYSITFFSQSLDKTDYANIESTDRHQHIRFPKRPAIPEGAKSVSSDLYKTTYYLKDVQGTVLTYSNKAGENLYVDWQ